MVHLGLLLLGSLLVAVGGCVALYPQQTVDLATGYRYESADLTVAGWLGRRGMGLVAAFLGLMACVVALRA